MPWSGVLTGLFGPVSINAHRRQAFIWGEIAAYLAGTGLLAVALWWWLDGRPLRLWSWFLCLTIGLVLAFWWYRQGVQLADAAKARLTRRSGLARVGRTDVRTVSRELPDVRKEYDPRRYYRDGDFFLGVDIQGKPVYMGVGLPHTSISGTSGAGKGRKLQDLAAQSVRNREAVFYLDPKDDEWGPHALYAACAEAGSTYSYLRLLPESPPQIDVLAGAKDWEIEELFNAAFGLGDVGSGADFYRAKDRRAAREAAQRAAAQGLTVAQVYEQMASDVYWQEEAPGFLSKLGELAQVDAVNATAGAFRLADVVADGGAVYVVGSMTLQAVKRAQQMIFVRVQQIATARDRIDVKPRTVCVIADEAKYHVSRPVLQGLGASRDKGMRVVLAFQSFDDLKDCPDDLNPEMVVGAIVENTPCKLIYRLEDPATAEWLAKKSGTVLVDDETRHLDKNLALSETTIGERSIRQAEHYLFDTNKLMNLPAGWCVCFGKGIAQALYVSPYRVAKCREAITPVVGAVAQTAKPEQVDTVPMLGHLQAAPSKKSGRVDNDFFSME